MLEQFKQYLLDENEYKKIHKYKGGIIFFAFMENLQYPITEYFIVSFYQTAEAVVALSLFVSTTMINHGDSSNLNQHHNSLW